MATNETTLLNMLPNNNLPKVEDGLTLGPAMYLLGRRAFQRIHCVGHTCELGIIGCRVWKWDSYEPSSLIKNSPHDCKHSKTNKATMRSTCEIVAPCFKNHTLENVKQFVVGGWNPIG
jgi:hypothetical protein